jgi:hypothetical protein
MVPSHLRRPRRTGLVRSAPLLIAGLVALAGCRGRAGSGGDTATDAERAAYAVRDQYTSRDAVPDAAWTWTSPSGTVFVMVDVESGVEGVVQGVADLWTVVDGTPRRVARSQLMPSVASMTALLFEDLTGDGVPDFLGLVADSAQIEYPVFLPGAQANLIDELELAGAGYHFDTSEQNAPTVLRGPGGRACALQLWAEAPAPDSLPAGRRYLGLLRGGRLDKPSPVPPDCGN